MNCAVHKRIRGDRVLWRLVTDRGEVLHRHIGVEHVVDEQVREHRVLAAFERHEHVVVDHALAVRREPVPKDLRAGALGQIVLRVDDVARPHLRNAELPGGKVVVGRDGDLRRGGLHHRAQLLADHLQVGLRRRVDVRNALAQKHHGHRGVEVVQHGDLALVRRIPEHVVRILHRADIGGHLIGPPAYSGGVDGVRHGVLPALVVPGVGEARPHVLDVWNVGVVQWPDQPAIHQTADLGVVGVVDVEVDSAAEFGDRLVPVVEGRDLDLRRVLVLEGLDGFGAEIVGVVVDLERRALLRREAVGDRLVVVGDRPLHRVVRRGDRQARSR